MSEIRLSPARNTDKSSLFFFNFRCALVDLQNNGGIAHFLRLYERWNTWMQLHLQENVSHTVNRPGILFQIIKFSPFFYFLLYHLHWFHSYLNLYISHLFDLFFYLSTLFFLSFFFISRYLFLQCFLSISFRLILFHFQPYIQIFSFIYFFHFYILLFSLHFQ